MPNKNNAKSNIINDILLKISGSGWLIPIIKIKPPITKISCLNTILTSPLDAENKKNRPSADRKKMLKNR